MDILGIGPLELLFIVLLALIVLGPKDMVKAGRSLGRALKAIVTSDTWKVVNQASREIRNLPNRLMREANLEDIDKQIPSLSELNVQTDVDKVNKSLKQAGKEDLSAWTTTPAKEPEQATQDASGGNNSPTGATPPEDEARTILPPGAAQEAAAPQAEALTPENSFNGAAGGSEEAAPDGEQEGDQQA